MRYVQPIKGLSQPAYRAQSRRVRRSHNEYLIGRVESHGQNVVKAATAVQNHMVELVPQHGEDLTRGRFRERLACFAVLWGG